MDEIKNENVTEEVVCDIAADATESDADVVESTDIEQTAQDETSDNTDAIANETENSDTATEQSQDESAQADGKTKKKIKLPQGLQKLVDKIKANENLRQMIVFTLFSFICGGSQLIISLVLPMLLKLSDSPVLQAVFPGFTIGSVPLFQYLGKEVSPGVYAGGVSDFIGFLVGSIVGQVLTFVLNRKKTFNCTNNIVISGIMYAIVAVAIIFAQTLVCGAILNALNNAVPDASDFLSGTVFNLVAQAVSGILGLVMSFLGNKFLVMRNWGEKKAKAAETTEEEK